MAPHTQSAGWNLSIIYGTPQQVMKKPVRPEVGLNTAHTVRALTPQGGR